MNTERLKAMSLTDIDGYARVLGLDTTGKKTKEAKVAAIEKARQRVAEVDVLGVTCTVPVRAVHDLGVGRTLRKGGRMTDAEAEELMERLLGDEQFAAVMEAATDDDGVVDSDAFGFGFWQLVNSDDLKNF
ncbi:MAG: hypothetical protein ACI364_02830 [Coriobacteriales bacterium]